LNIFGLYGTARGFVAVPMEKITVPQTGTARKKTRVPHGFTGRLLRRKEGCKGMSDETKEYSAKTLVYYREKENEPGSIFIRLCPVCGRFVKADDSINCNIDGVPIDEANATCKKHGRVQMPFYCWSSDFETE
jgi:hypothetical protein